jgi:hypothetical protein
VQVLEGQVLNSLCVGACVNPLEGPSWLVMPATNAYNIKEIIQCPLVGFGADAVASTQLASYF